MARQGSILVVAGEASADLHGAKVVNALRTARPGVRLFGIGGVAMREAGLEAVVRAEQISVAGLTEVLFALPRIWLLMRKLVREAKKRRPAVAVLMDLPDFNLPLAARLKRLGIPVVYYISPQLWAWRSGRVRQIQARVDEMLVILPFEEAFYHAHGMQARFVGHPLLEELQDPVPAASARQALGIDEQCGPVVALLPGSRRKELTRHLPIMLESVRLLAAEFPQLRPVVPVADTVPRRLVDAMVARARLPTPVQVLGGQATLALSAADAAVVCSGTATLQTALLARPMVVVYKVSWLTFRILKRLVKVAHIALVNLVAGRPLVAELVQTGFTAQNVFQEVRKLLTDAALRERLRHEFAALRSKLGVGQTAPLVAETALRYLPAPRKTGRSLRNNVEAQP